MPLYDSNPDPIRRRRYTPTQEFSRKKRLPTPVEFGPTPNVGVPMNKSGGPLFAAQNQSQLTLPSPHTNIGPRSVTAGIK